MDRPWPDSSRPSPLPDMGRPLVYAPPPRSYLDGAAFIFLVSTEACVWFGSARSERQAGSPPQRRTVAPDYSPHKY